jgi:transcriptional regulator with GAF, ATPase, and Fis domain
VPGGVAVRWASCLSDCALTELCDEESPGNVRELEDVIERAYLVARKERRVQSFLQIFPRGSCSR